jgi:aldehyde:ferredoxin oxidoreductase
MPERITSEAIPSGPTAGRRLTTGDYAFMLDEYYTARRWDADGVPKPETVRRLGLSDLG